MEPATQIAPSATATHADLLAEVEQLRAENARLRKQDQLGLVFPYQPEDLVERSRIKLPLLSELPELSFGEHERPHLLIEGDNYPALVALNYTHHRKLPLIYIDPPYNIEDSGFIYNDKRVSSDDAFRHSKWLSFMEHRLAAAVELLADDGVMLISIDEHELAPLMMLCESAKVFGPGHLLGIVTWIKRTQPTNSGRAKFQLQQNIEYVLAYSKCLKSDFPGFQLQVASEKRYPHQGRFGACRFENLVKSDNGRMARETMKFAILGVTPPAWQRWQIGEKTARELEQAGKIELVEGFPKRAVYPEDEPDAVSYKPFWSHFDKEITGTAQTGKKELEARIGKHHFDTVKPVALLCELLSHFPDDITVLDFFAGSGTTGEAVATMNARDGGTRQAILCTNNESNICREITQPRLRAAYLGYQDAKGEPVAGLDAALRFFSVEREFVEVSGSRDETKLAFRKRCDDLLRLREGCYTPLSLSKDWAIYGSDRQLLAVLYKPAKEQQLIQALQKLDAALPIALYVFSIHGAYDASPFHQAFAARLSLQTIPEELLRTYERVMQPRRRKQ